MHFSPQSHLVILKRKVSLAKWLCMSIHVRSITQLGWLALLVWDIRFSLGYSHSACS